MKKPERLGPYIIGEPIGKGGMGHVYGATHAETGDPVAVKVLSPELASSEGFRERFDAEIESLRLLRHPNIVRLFGWGEEADVLFYAMERVDGPSLEEELRAGRRFDWRETTQISIQICRALKNAHDHGIVHRDIKPANVLLAAGDQVKLADFGIARLFGGSQLTMAGGVLGTADFMSPEQADGRSVTDRSDQYSLGCVMYALLAGRPPFKAKTLPEMLQLQRFAEPEPVYRFAPYTPAQLADAINQLLAKEPEQRFPNTLVLAKHLEAMHHALTRPPRSGEPLPSEDDFDLPLDDSGSADVGDFMPTLAEHASKASVEASGSSSAAEFDETPAALPDSHQRHATHASSRELQTEASVVLDKTDDTAPLPKPARFTTIAEHSLAAKKEGALPANRLLVLLQTVAAVALLAGLAYTVYLTSQPRTAGELYEVIMAAVDREQPDLPAVSAEMDEFLREFPDDERTPRVAELRQQLELERLDRRMRMAARLRGEPMASVPPEKRLYLEVLRIANEEPELAREHLESLIALLEISPSGQKQEAAGSEPSEGDPTGERPREQPDGQEAARLLAEREELLALAQQKLRELSDQVEQIRQDQRPFLRDRLEAAQALAEEDPASARRIVTAILKLYGSKPWAAAEVREAQKLLDTLPAVAE